MESILKHEISVQIFFEESMDSKRYVIILKNNINKIKEMLKMDIEMR